MGSRDPRDIIHSRDLIEDFVEGRGMGAHILPTFTPNPTFKRMVVLEVIPDPVSVLDSQDRKLNYWRSVLGVTNMEYSTVLPRNTIIAQFAYTDANPMFVFPFFSSHLAMPCKPGEMVWTMVEDPSLNQLKMAYWLCRITEPHIADDVNHTHPARTYDETFAGVDATEKRERFVNDGKTSPIYELRNGDTITRADGERHLLDTRKIIYNAAEDDVYFESLVTFTDAAKLSQFEAVPRFKKRPGDVAIEGSNNSLIVLGTDRIGPISNFEITPQNQNLGPRPRISSLEMTGSAGSIDLVVGRGQTSATFGVEAETRAIVGSSSENLGPVIKKEIAKAQDQISPFEGDPDLFHDRSRVLISQKTKVDRNFDLNTYNTTNFQISDDSINGDAAIVIKTDKIRLIARSDIEIIVKGFIPGPNPVDEQVKFEYAQEGNSDKFAAIVIKANGDIIFKPSQTGYIKLGSDSANKALLCTDAPAIATNGAVTAAAISDTSVGFIGTGAAGQGTWAKKVLVD